MLRELLNSLLMLVPFAALYFSPTLFSMCTCIYQTFTKELSSFCDHSSGTHVMINEMYVYIFYLFRQFLCRVRSRVPGNLMQVVFSLTYSMFHSFIRHLDYRLQQATVGVIVIHFTSFLLSYLHVLVQCIHILADFIFQKNRVEGLLKTLLQFCQRNSNRADEKTRQSMWMPVFDYVLCMLNKHHSSLNEELPDGDWNTA